jgi:hypothetical protein
MMRDAMADIAENLSEEFDIDFAEMVKADEERFDNMPGESVIAKAANVEIVRLLVAAGADFADISDEIRAELKGLELEGEIVCSHEEYHAGKYRVFGEQNPTPMNLGFWQAMVRSGQTAYRARVTFEGEDYDFGDQPVWCYHRFGMSFTELPDGRIIEIGGEHEDSYDPDFCIYNDVFVHHGAGRFDIFGYPEKVFPPADFHTATLVGDYIYIIGCLGYPRQRRSNYTPVYRLHCQTLEVEKIKTSGDNPGWIWKHKAHFRSGASGEGEIIVSGGEILKKVRRKEEHFDNSDSYVLNLMNMRWSRVD